MAMSDPLADMLTRIRNAGMAKHETVEIPLSKLKVGVADILKKEGFIRDYEVSSGEKLPLLKVQLKYDDHRTFAITGLKRVSKPGRRIYVKHDRIPKVMSGLGVAIVSTSQGVMTDKEARQRKLGGELLCEVW